METLALSNTEAVIAKKPQMHFSGLDKLWACGEAFRRRYILGEKDPGNVRMSVGTAVDRAVNQNLGEKILTGKLLPLEAVKDAARDGMEIEFNTGRIEFDAEEKAQGIPQVKAEAIAKAVRLAVLHATQIAPNLHPTHVQRAWALELPGFPFDVVGTIDVQEGPIAVRDTKTSGKSPSASIADMSDQLTLYALAVKVLDGDPPATVALDYLIDNKTPVAKTFMSTRDADDYAVIMARMENAAEVIQKGAFTPARPTDWVCSIAYCSFFRTCRYAKQPKQFAMGGK